jgi:hypothetical protein
MNMLTLMNMLTMINMLTLMNMLTMMNVLTRQTCLCFVLLVREKARPLYCMPMEVRKVGGVLRSLVEHVNLRYLAIFANH